MPSPTPAPYPPTWPPSQSANFGDWIWSASSNIWEWFGSQQAAVVALATVVTAVIAIVALISTARDSTERSRPIVLAYFRLSPHNESAFDLVLHNFGTSAAFDIDVTFDPPFSEEQRKNHMVDALAQRYGKRVPVMPPGSEITNVWWALDYQSPGEGKNRYPIPDDAAVTITYKGNRIRRHKDMINLDTNWMKGDTSTVSSSSRPGIEKQNADSLKKIAAESRAIRRLVGDIAGALEGDEPEHKESENLVELIESSGSDITSLSRRLGVTEQKAAEIIDLLERNPSTGDVDVVSSGQIVPGSAGIF